MFAPHSSLRSSFRANIVLLQIFRLLLQLAIKIRELKKFEKIYLKSEEIQKVSFFLDYIDFAYYNTMLRKYVVENGIYNIYVDASSQDIRLNTTFEINDDSSPYSTDCVGDSIVG